MRRQQRAGVVHGLPVGEEALRAAWEGQGMAWRRRLVAVVVERVAVGPAVKGQNFFNPDRVAVVWRA